MCPRCKHGLIILQGQDYFHKGPHYDPDENGNPSVFSWSKSFNITAAPKVIVFGAFIKITALEVRFFLDKRAVTRVFEIYIAAYKKG